MIAGASAPGLQCLVSSSPGKCTGRSSSYKWLASTLPFVRQKKNPRWSHCFQISLALCTYSPSLSESLPSQQCYIMAIIVYMYQSTMGMWQIKWTISTFLKVQQSFGKEACDWSHSLSHGC